MVFQSYALFPHMSVLENVALRPAPCRACRGARRASGRATALAHGRPRRATTSACRRELSGGQQQRVAVARALVLEPSVLLFDEPLSNLDARLRRQMREEIRELQQRLGLTVVYVTHDQEEAMAVSRPHHRDERRPRSRRQGAPRELYERPATPFVAGFMGESNPAKGHARRIGPKQIRLRLGDAEIDLADETASDGEVTVAIRPEAITVETNSGPAGALAGTIAKASYLGTHMEYSIDTAAGLLFATCPRVERPLGPGSPVSLLLAPRGVIVVATR